MAQRRRSSGGDRLCAALLLVLLAGPAYADPPFKGSAAPDIICDADRGVCKEWVPPAGYVREFWSWGKGRGDWWSWLTARIFGR